MILERIDLLVTTMIHIESVVRRTPPRKISPRQIPPWKISPYPYLKLFLLSISPLKYLIFYLREGLT